MSLQSPVLGEALLVLPEVGSKSMGEVAAQLDEVHQKLAVAHARVMEQAKAGEEVFRIAVALREGKAGDLLPLVESELTRNLHKSPSIINEAGASEELSADYYCILTLYSQAASLLANGEIDGAIAMLCALLDWDEARNDALLGLAICAVRLERYEEALALGLDYLKRGGRHPRSHCIIGLCYLKAGEKRLAQNHLAAAARAARGDAAYRDELRDAQRLLIMLNFNI